MKGPRAQRQHLHRFDNNTLAFDINTKIYVPRSRSMYALLAQKQQMRGCMLALTVEEDMHN